MNLLARPRVKLENKKIKRKVCEVVACAFAFSTMTKHNTARSRTSLSITQQSYQFFNQIPEILTSQNGILIIDIWNSALEIRNLVQQLQTL